MFKSMTTMNSKVTLQRSQWLLRYSKNNSYKDLQINRLRSISSLILPTKSTPQSSTTNGAANNVNRNHISKQLQPNSYAQNQKYCARNFSTLFGDKIEKFQNPFSTIGLHQTRYVSSSSSSSSSNPHSSSQPLSTSTKPQPSTTSKNNVSVKLVEKDSTVILRYDEGVYGTRRLPLIWLRDHCRCGSCYNQGTGQKEFIVNPLEHDLGVKDVSLQDGDNLVINWKDGHKSEWNVDWLLQNSFYEQATPPVLRTLWDKKMIEEKELPTVTLQEHMETEEGRLQTCRNIVEYGFSLVTGVPVSMDGTQEVVERIAPLQNTFFYDGMWSFTADGKHSDSAWSDTFIGPHTDNTYLEIPAGFQVFHCLQHDGKGGETILVDGFKAIETLKRNHPNAAKFLSSHAFAHEYKEPAMNNRPPYHLHAVCPIIRLHPATGEPIQLRFNVYDRAPLNTIPPEKIPEFYESYHYLTTEINRPENEIRLKLKPGTTIFIDNWRVLHGRAGFNGYRHMAGCYTRRDDWMSTVRTLGLVSSTH